MNLPEPSSETVPAARPFNQPSADFTLRTSDAVDFLVHSQILSQASPFFSDMFSLPQPPHPGTRGVGTSARPVIDVAEDSKTLEQLLRLCYPIKKSELDTLGDIIPVLKAAMKYDMEWPISSLTKDLLAMVPTDPLGVWAVACRSGLEDVARAAALGILGRGAGAGSSRTPLDTLHSLLQAQGTSVFDGVCAGDYFRLRQFLRLPVPGDPLFKLLGPAGGTLEFDDLPPGSATFTPSLPSPDIALQCPDGTRFLAHHVVISLHSAKLKMMIDVVRSAFIPDTNIGTTTEQSNVPVLELDAEPRTFALVLNACYGGPLPTDALLAPEVLSFATEHEMEQIRVLATEAWNRAAASDPLQAYFVAIKRPFGSSDYVRWWARKTLERPIADAYAPVMESASALSYHHLLEYYRACARAVGDAMEKAAIDSSQTIGRVSGHRGTNLFGAPLSNVNYHYNNAISDYIRGLAQRAENEGPGKDFEITVSALFKQSCANRTVWPSPQCDTTTYHGLVQVLIDLASGLPQAIVQLRPSGGAPCRLTVVRSPLAKSDLRCNSDQTFRSYNRYCIQLTNCGPAHSDV